MYVKYTFVPSRLGMPGLQEEFCARCGCAAICREGRAAADRTCSRTVASPGHGPDRLEPVEESLI